MQEVGAQDAFARVADLLGDPLRGHVVRVGDQLHALHAELLECHPRHETERRRADAAPTGVRGHPVADMTPVAVFVQPQVDGAEKSICLRVYDRERQSLRAAVETPAHVGLGVVPSVRPRDERDPARDLGVLAGDHDRVQIVRAPWSEKKIAVSKLHASSLRPGSGSTSSRLHTPKRCAVRAPHEGVCRATGIRSCGSRSSAQKVGGVLLSRGLAPRVPSALAGLTSLFGMERGVSPPL